MEAVPPDRKWIPAFGCKGSSRAAVGILRLRPLGRRDVLLFSAAETHEIAAAGLAAPAACAKPHLDPHRKRGIIVAQIPRSKILAQAARTLGVEQGTEARPMDSVARRTFSTAGGKAAVEQSQIVAQRTRPPGANARRAAKWTLLSMTHSVSRLLRAARPTAGRADERRSARDSHLEYKPRKSEWGQRRRDGAQRELRQRRLPAVWNDRPRRAGEGLHAAGAARGALDIGTLIRSEGLL